eukprot:scaffold4949_cov59-Attheya_sp.AAC.4
MEKAKWKNIKSDAGSDSDGMACPSGEFDRIGDLVDSLGHFLEISVDLGVCDVLWQALGVDENGHWVG